MVGKEPFSASYRKRFAGWVSGQRFAICSFTEASWKAVKKKYSTQDSDILRAEGHKRNDSVVVNTASS